MINKTFHIWAIKGYNNDIDLAISLKIEDNINLRVMTPEWICGTTDDDILYLSFNKSAKSLKEWAINNGVSYYHKIKEIEIKIPW